MSGERDRVETVRTDIETDLAGEKLTVATGHRLPYAVLVAAYGSSGKPVTKSHGYQTDLLIAEQPDDAGDWVPRVVVEFKLGSISTHDALTYSAKAATHKNVHPYLRYGIIIGRYAGQIPQRLLRHGHHFDFMMTLVSDRLTTSDRDRIAGLLRDEVRASRTLSRLLSERSTIRLLHRKLDVT